MSNMLLSKLFIAVGTYDGALAGWEMNLWSNGEDRKLVETSNGVSKPTCRLQLTFATSCHDGSVRCLCFASNSTSSSETPVSTDTAATVSPCIYPGSLLSCGFDEMLRTHDWSKNKTGLGEVRTPSDFGTPLCASFAPPPLPPLLHPILPGNNNNNSHISTHCLVGFSQGKIVIYRKRDWSIQHVLAGHEGGVSCLAIHPSGKLALSGGQSDGKLKLWDLTKGRLAYATQVLAHHDTTKNRHRRIYDVISSLVWSPDGTAYGYCHGRHITVRHVDSGMDLLDVDDIPSRVNQIALLLVEEGLFVAAACDDGSLPVLQVSSPPSTERSNNNLEANNNDIGDDDEEDNNLTRRAIMAIEPVDGTVAGEERFKCIQLVSGYHVVTANSAGVVSLMNLKGAILMITKPDDDPDDNEEQVSQQRRHANADEDKEIDDDDEEELAVDIVDSVQLGQGTRITCLSVWVQPMMLTNGPNVAEVPSEKSPSDNDNNLNGVASIESVQDEEPGDKRKRSINMDVDSMKKARELVSQARELQKRKDRRKKTRKA